MFFDHLLDDGIEIGLSVHLRELFGDSRLLQQQHINNISSESMSVVCFLDANSTGN